MLEIVVQLNVPFIMDALKEVQDTMVGPLKIDSLMGNFVIMQPFSAVELSYQAIQMDLVDLNQIIPLMEVYDLVT